MAEHLVDRKHNREVEQMRESDFIADWIKEDIPKRFQLGFQLGFLLGFQQGFRQGKQELLIRLLATKFGELPQSVTEQIQRMTISEELDQLGVRLLTAESLEEMGLNGEQSR